MGRRLGCCRTSSSQKRQFLPHHEHRVIQSDRQTRKRSAKQTVSTDAPSWESSSNYLLIENKRVVTRADEPSEQNQRQLGRRVRFRPSFSFPPPFSDERRRVPRLMCLPSAKFMSARRKATLPLFGRYSFPAIMTWVMRFHLRCERKRAYEEIRSSGMTPVIIDAARMSGLQVFGLIKNTRTPKFWQSSPRVAMPRCFG